MPPRLDRFAVVGIDIHRLLRQEPSPLPTPIGQAVATIMSALAEMELALIRERAAAASDAARPGAAR